MLSRNAYARLGVIHYFVLEGVLTGTWASQLPDIQDSFDISDSILGLSVLFVYLGTVLATPLAGYLIRSKGSKVSTSIAACMLHLCKYLL